MRKLLFRIALIMRQHHLKYLFFLAVFSCPLILHALDLDSLATSTQAEKDDSTKV